MLADVVLVQLKLQTLTLFVHASLRCELFKDLQVVVEILLCLILLVILFRLIDLLLRPQVFDLELPLLHLKHDEEVESVLHLHDLVLKSIESPLLP